MQAKELSRIHSSLPMLRQARDRLCITTNPRVLRYKGHSPLEGKVYLNSSESRGAHRKSKLNSLRDRRGTIKF